MRPIAARKHVFKSPENHKENGGTLGMVLFTGYISLKGLVGEVKQLWYHPKGTTIFPMGEMGINYAKLNCCVGRIRPVEGKIA